MPENRKPIFTLKNVAILLIVGCLVSYVVARSQAVAWDRRRLKCLDSLHNLNQALVLYRADWQGFSPGFSDDDRAQMEKTMRKYAGDKAIVCPQITEFNASNLRATWKDDGSKFNTPYGIQDTSLAFAPCSEHWRTVPSFEFESGTGPRVAHRPARPDGGKTNVLLRNGTAKSIPWLMPTERWAVIDGKFAQTQAAFGSGGIADLYPFEPKPPQFEY